MLEGGWRLFSIANRTIWGLVNCLLNEISNPWKQVYLFGLLNIGKFLFGSCKSCAESHFNFFSTCQGIVVCKRELSHNIKTAGSNRGYYSNNKCFVAMDPIPTWQTPEARSIKKGVSNRHTLLLKPKYIKQLGLKLILFDPSTLKVKLYIFLTF